MIGRGCPVATPGLEFREIEPCASGLEADLGGLERAERLRQMRRRRVLVAGGERHSPQAALGSPDPDAVRGGARQVDA